MTRVAVLGIDDPFLLGALAALERRPPFLAATTSADPVLVVDSRTTACSWDDGPPRLGATNRRERRADAARSRRAARCRG